MYTVAYLITWNFRDTLISRISKNSQNLSDAKIKCRKNNITWKLSDSLYVNN